MSAGLSQTWMYGKKRGKSRTAATYGYTPEQAELMRRSGNMAQYIWQQMQGAKGLYKLSPEERRWQADLSRAYAAGGFFSPEEQALKSQMGELIGRGPEYYMPKTGGITSGQLLQAAMQPTLGWQSFMAPGAYREAETTLRGALPTQSALFAEQLKRNLGPYAQGAGLTGEQLATAMGGLGIQQAQALAGLQTQRGAAEMGAKAQAAGAAGRLGQLGVPLAQMEMEAQAMPGRTMAALTPFYQQMGLTAQTAPMWQQLTSAMPTIQAQRFAQWAQMLGMPPELLARLAGISPQMIASMGRTADTSWATQLTGSAQASMMG